MNHLQMTPYTFDVWPLYDQLRLHPEIWNEIPYRTKCANTPHREVDDIWVRYNSLSKWDGGKHFNDKHESVWYPIVEKIPAARLLAVELMSYTDARFLGGVLITRVPPGGQVYPHVDPGWHASFYEKFIIQVAGNQQQRFCFEGEWLSAEPGQCYWFDNQFKHWVLNESKEERISLIVCLRRETCH